MLAPILNDDLFRVLDGSGDSTIMFLPRLGQNIDCAVLDEDGDGGPADLDNSGHINVFDLALLLGAWGPCP